MISFRYKWLIVLFTAAYKVYIFMNPLLFKERYKRVYWGNRTMILKTHSAVWPEVSVAV